MHYGQFNSQTEAFSVSVPCSVASIRRQIVSHPQTAGKRLCVGQVVKEVKDVERCRDVFPGDVLVAINNVTVQHWSHDDVVNVLRQCRPRRVATFTLMTSRGTDRAAPVRSAAAAAQPRSTSAMASPLSADGHADSSQYVNYNEIYWKLYSRAPFVRVNAPETTQMRSADARRAAAVTSNGGEPDVLLTSRYSAPPTADLVGGSPAPRRPGPGRRQQPRRSLPTQPTTYVDLLSPLVPRRVSRDSSQSSLNFSGTPDFIPASAYLDDDDRRRRATGRPPVDHELAALALNDPVFTLSATNTPAHRDDLLDNDSASIPSSGSLRNGAAAGLPVTSSATSGYPDRRTPADFIVAGNESCNGYNARTEAVHSAAPIRHHPPSHPRQRSQSALDDAVGPGREAHRRPEMRLSADGGYERAGVAMTAKSGSLDRRDVKGSLTPSRVAELTEPPSESPAAPVISVSSSTDIVHLLTLFENFEYFVAPLFIGCVFNT